MRLETAKSFLRYRKEQERELFESVSGQDLLPGLLTVEINITELCNRKCTFCPRIDPSIYPNRKLEASDILIERVTSELMRLEYKRKISFSGFGEPLLNKSFVSYVKYIRSMIPDVVIETNTNGDFLTTELLDSLWDAGLSAIYWNLYDGPEQLRTVEEVIERSIFPEKALHVRPHWVKFDNSGTFNLFLNNRAGNVTLAESSQTPSVRGVCYYPFYKLFLDWNGNVLCCSNDWGREKIIGNIYNRKLDEIWMDSEWMEFRRALLRGKRRQEPCNKCDINGTLFGHKSVELLKTFFATD